MPHPPLASAPAARPPLPLPSYLHGAGAYPPPPHAAPGAKRPWAAAAAEPVAGGVRGAAPPTLPPYLLPLPERATAPPASKKMRRAAHPSYEAEVRAVLEMETSAAEAEEDFFSFFAEQLQDIDAVSSLTAGGAAAGPHHVPQFAYAPLHAPHSLEA